MDTVYVLNDGVDLHVFTTRDRAISYLESNYSEVSDPIDQTPFGEDYRVTETDGFTFTVSLMTAFYNR